MEYTNISKGLRMIIVSEVIFALAINFLQGSIWSILVSSVLLLISNVISLLGFISTSSGDCRYRIAFSLSIIYTVVYLAFLFQYIFSKDNSMMPIHLVHYLSQFLISFNVVSTTYGVIKKNGFKTSSLVSILKNCYYFLFIFSFSLWILQNSLGLDTKLLNNMNHVFIVITIILYTYFLGLTSNALKNRC